MPESRASRIAFTIYPPFLKTVHRLKRRLIENPLRHGAQGFATDLDGLRAKAASALR